MSEHSELGQLRPGYCDENAQRRRDETRLLLTVAAAVLALAPRPTGNALLTALRPFFAELRELHTDGFVAQSFRARRPD